MDNSACKLSRKVSPCNSDEAMGDSHPVQSTQLPDTSFMLGIQVHKRKKKKKKKKKGFFEKNRKIRSDMITL